MFGFCFLKRKKTNLGGGTAAVEEEMKRNNNVIGGGTRVEAQIEAIEIEKKRGRRRKKALALIRTIERSNNLNSKMEIGMAGSGEYLLSENELNNRIDNKIDNRKLKDDFDFGDATRLFSS